MIRQIIKIDEEKCSGCGACVDACHEGAIAMVNGKARLMRDDYCDGLGNCLPACPTGAITFEEREAAEYNEEAVKAKAQQQVHVHEHSHAHGGGCPGSMARSMERKPAPVVSAAADRPQSELNQWPVQIKLVPVNAPYFEGANLLVAADCTAFAYGDFHRRFMRNHVTLVGCPKLDEGDYAEKLGAILVNNNIKSVRVVRMQVPCCGGIENAVKRAMLSSGKMIPWQVIVLSPDGEILED